MFCPYCGTESTQGLNYCKRCGGSLAPLAQGGSPLAPRPPAVAPGAAWAAGKTTAAVVIGGVAAICLIASDLAARDSHPATLVWVTLFVALTVFGCTALLLRFWSLLFGVARPSQQQAPALPDQKATDTRELAASRFDSLGPAPAPSVTEQTTRTLEHAERKY